MTEDEQLAAAKAKALFKLAPNVVMSVIGAALVIAVYWSPERAAGLTVWACLIVSHAGLLLGVYLVHKRNVIRLADRRALQFLTALYAISGLNWGFGLAWLLPQGNSDQTLIANLIALGAVVTTFPTILHLPVYLAYQIPVLLLGALGMWFSPNPYGWMIAIGAILLSAALSATAKVMSEALGNALRLSTVNAELARKLSSQAANLQQANDQLTRVNSNDALTGLGNRRSLMTALRAERGNGDCAIMLLEIDQLRAYAETFGYISRDRCLKVVADLLVETARQHQGVVFRYGVEQFALVLRNAPRETLAATTEHIRSTVDGAHDRGSRINRRVTASIGFARDLANQSVEQLLDAAGDALDEARNVGGNKVVDAHTLRGVKAKSAA